jgi:hypothetical protein
VVPENNVFQFESDSTVYKVTASVGNTVTLDMVPQITDFTVARVGTVISGEFSAMSMIPGDREVFLNVSLSDPFNAENRIFDGARFIVSTDARNATNVFSASMSDVTVDAPRITFSIAKQLETGSQVAVRRGQNAGLSFYHTDVWVKAQQKVTTNQPPLFDVFTANGTSFSDTSLFPATTFVGSSVFGFSKGANFDTELQQLVKYATLGSLGDLEFTNFFATDEFSCVEDQATKSVKVSSGFLKRDNELCTTWTEAAAESCQYQVIEVTASAGTNSVKLGVPLQSDMVWPAVKLKINDKYVTDFSVTDDVVTFDAETDDLVKVLFLSKTKSAKSFFESPINLECNPLNDEATTLTMGALRRHFETIFINGKLSGAAFNANSYRDTFHPQRYGTQIVQHSASLVNAGLFLTNPNFDAVSAIEYASNEYVKFKSILADVAASLAFEEYVSAADMLDQVLEVIAGSKSESSPFYWTDMLATGTPTHSETYFIGTDASETTFRLNMVYTQNAASYEAVYVYLTRGGETYQLFKNIDYFLSEDSPELYITKQLNEDDSITINEYERSFGSFVPNTPAKFALTPIYTPEIYIDNTYLSATPVLKGHDGSLTKLYSSSYTEGGVLYDARDKVLFEFECRVFNNIKARDVGAFDIVDITPGAFRESTTTFSQTNSTYFMNWCGKNRVQMQSNLYLKTDSFTWNYKGARTKLGHEITSGNWRGIYMFLFDTVDPSRTPWEMVGHAIKPSWFDERYGQAPYTKNNLLLWGDMEAGVDWNNGNPIVLESRKRPGLTRILPVNEQGELLSPYTSVIDTNTFDQAAMADRVWGIGDVGPTEYAYTKSSAYAFDLAKAFMQYKPAKFFSLFFDTDNFKPNMKRAHSVHQVKYGSGVSQHGYVTWLVDFALQTGVNAATELATLLENVDVRTCFRLSGFSDKNSLKFYIEKATPSSSSKNLLIPDENFSVLMHEESSPTPIVYSAVIVEKTNAGWRVWGNSQSRAYFETATGKRNGYYQSLDVLGETLLLTKETDTSVIQYVAYGHEFLTLQELCEFVKNYMTLLEHRGMVFDFTEAGLVINANRIISELITWYKTGWGVGSIVCLNPAANKIKIQRKGYVVQPLTLHQKNFVLNQNAIPIQLTDLCVHRDGNAFEVEPLNSADSLAFGVFNLYSIEHIVVFDNTTLFGDVIRNNTAGVKQTRMVVSGTKTSGWNGFVNAAGFVLNFDNVPDWTAGTKYPRGTIVKLKNSYWTAKVTVQPSNNFDQAQWYPTEFDQIQKGLLANPAQRAAESQFFYDLDNTNLEKDTGTLGLSLIGFRNREYLSSADLSDVTQSKVFTHMVRGKGTQPAVELFKNATLMRGEIDYTVTENWAIKTHDFGAVNKNRLVEFNLTTAKLTDNPSIVTLTSEGDDTHSHESVDIRYINSYGGSTLTTVDVFPTTVVNTVNAGGFVNTDHVTYSVATFNDATTADIVVGQRIWVTNFEGRWGVFEFVRTVSKQNTTLALTQTIDNGNGTVSLAMSSDPALTINDLIAVVDFGQSDGFYKVVQKKKQVLVCERIDGGELFTESGSGMLIKLESVRFAQATDISAKSTHTTAWVESDPSGKWSVLQKNNDYAYAHTMTLADSYAFGSSVVQTPTGIYSIDTNSNQLAKFSAFGQFV